MLPWGTPPGFWAQRGHLLLLPFGLLSERYDYLFQSLIKTYCFTFIQQYLVVYGTKCFLQVRHCHSTVLAIVNIPFNEVS